MIILLSPSKTINPKPVEKWVNTTNPIFIKDAKKLVAASRKLGPELASVFGVSDKIAAVNREQFKVWQAEPEDNMGAPAAWAYRGETYFGLSIEKMDKKTLAFANDHVLLVSGLYGLLHPTDTIMPYRLEMSTRLAGKWGKNLYEYWGNRLAKHIVKQEPTFVLCCASEEYAKSVRKHLSVDVPMITPKFLHEGKSKMAFAKYSRGLLARWACENRVENPADLQKFNVEGYRYNHKLSTPTQPVFEAPAGFTIKGRFTIL